MYDDGVRDRERERLSQEIKKVRKTQICSAWIL